MKARHLGQRKKHEYIPDFSMKAIAAAPASAPAAAAVATAVVVVGRFYCISVK